MSKPGPERRGGREYREMTVALIRDRIGTDAVEVAFSESARFYELSRKNPDFERILRRLREAWQKKLAVRVMLDLPEGDLIDDVEAEA
jgi:hypothetical protein